MTLLVPTTGTRVLVGKKLANTSATAIIAAVGAGKKKMLESLSVSCDSTGATDFSLWYSDGTTNFYIYSTKSIGASDTLFVKDHHLSLREGWSLSCQAGTANNLDVVAVVIESSASEGSNSQK